MNHLSWLIYLASVAGSIGFVCAATIILGLIATIVFALAGFSDIKGAFAAMKQCIRAVAIAAIVGTLVPSKSAVYAIAASEYGGQMLKTTTATKAQTALDAWLDEQIASRKNKEKE